MKSKLPPDPGIKMKMKNLKPYLSAPDHLDRQGAPDRRARAVVRNAAGRRLDRPGRHGQGERKRAQIYQDELIPLTSINEVARGSLNSFISLSEAAFHKDDKAIVKQKLDEVAKTAGRRRGPAEEAGLRPDVAGGQETVEGVRERPQRRVVVDDRDHRCAEQGRRGRECLLYSDVLPNVSIMGSEMNKLIAMQVEESRQQYESALASYKRIRLMTFAALGAGMLLAVLMAFFLIRSIVGTLNRAVRVANAISQGQLGHNIVTRRKDELGKSAGGVPMMDERLTLTVGEVRRGSRCGQHGGTADRPRQPGPRRAPRSRPPAWRRPRRRWRS